MAIKFYNYIYRTNDTDGSLVKTVMANTEKPELYAVLPIGTFELAVEIWDILDAVAEYTVEVVTTVEPSQDQVDQYNIYDIIDKLSGSPLIAMYLNAFNSIKIDDYISELEFLEAEATQNSSYSDVLEVRILELTDETYDQLSIVDTFPFPNNINQAIISSNVLVSATSILLKAPIGSNIADLKNKKKIVSSIERIVSGIDGMEVNSAEEYIPLMRNVMKIVTAVKKSINTVIDSGNNVPAGDLIVAADMEYDVDPNAPIATNLKESHLLNVFKRTIEQSEDLYERLDKVYSYVTDAILKKMVKGDIHSIRIDEGMSCLLAKFGEAQFKREGLAISTNENNPATVNIPAGFCPSKIVNKSPNCGGEVSFRITQSQFQTRIYSSTAHFISPLSQVVGVDTIYGGKEVDISNQNPPIYVAVPHMSGGENSNFTEVDVLEEIDPNIPLVYHLFNIYRPQAAFLIELRPSSNPENMIMLIDYGRFPIPKSHHLKFLVRHLDVFNETFSLVINTTVNQNKSGDIVIGIGRLSSNFDLGSDLENSNMDKNFGTNYKIRISVTGCYFFDVKTRKWKEDKNVQVTDFHGAHTNCSASHLTEFGTGYVFSQVKSSFQLLLASAGLSDEMTVLSVIILIIAFYVLLMIWGLYVDRKNKSKTVSTAFPDNDPKHNYAYEIIAHTGPDSEAACESKISIIISGEFAETSIRSLPDPNPNLYRRYSHNNFVMTTSKPLGRIHSLRVIHDNSGRPPYDSWQLERIVIHDLQTHTFYFFEINSWLTLDRANCLIDCTFQCTNNLNVASFSQRLYSAFHKAVNEDHIWLSIFLCPPFSRFKCAERISVAGMFLSLSSSLGAFYYQWMGESPRESGFDFISLLEISSSEFFSGTIIQICVYCITLMFIFVLNRAKPKTLKACRAVAALEAQREQQLEVSSSKSKLKIISRNSPNRKVEPNTWSFPWWTRWLTWIAMFVIIAISIYVVISFSFTWGYNRSQKWLVTFLISFGSSLFITEWLRICFVAVIDSTCREPTYLDDIDCDESVAEIEYEEKLSAFKSGTSSAQKINLLRGVEKNKIKEERERLTKFREMKYVSRGILIYCCFLIVLIVITSDRADINSFWLQQHFTRTFIKRPGYFADISKTVIIECLSK